MASAGVATGVEWVEYWDESAGASYFFNTVTQVWLGGWRSVRDFGWWFALGNVSQPSTTNFVARPTAGQIPAQLTSHA